MSLVKPTERSIIADIISLLPQLSEDGLRRVQAEMNIALGMIPKPIKRPFHGCNAPGHRKAGILHPLDKDG
jgi:hypothetical protein